MAKNGKKGAFKIEASNNSGVIVTHAFVTAATANSKGKQFSGSLNYLLRESATLQEIQIDSLAVEETEHDRVFERDNEKYLKNETNVDQIEQDKILRTLERYQIGYRATTDYLLRNSAVSLEDTSLGETAGFNADTLNMTNERVGDAQRAFDIGQNNNNPLHEMAISFRTQFLIDQELYDPGTKNVDEKRIKVAVQDSMKRFLADIDLGADIEWVGSIQHDTEHLHVHVNFVKVNPETRQHKLMYNNDSQMIEPIGELQQRAFERIISKTSHGLESDKTRRMLTPIYERKTQLRDSLKLGVSDNLEVKRGTSKYVNELAEIYKMMPKNKRDWQVGKFGLQAGKNEMRPVNQRVSRLLDTILQNELKTDFDEFVATAKEVQRNSPKLSKNNNEYVNNQIENELKKPMANQLYKSFKELNESDLKQVLELDNEMPPLEDSRSKNLSDDVEQTSTHDINKGNDFIKHLETVSHASRTDNQFNSTANQRTGKNNETHSKAKSNMWKNDVKFVSLHKSDFANQVEKKIEKRRLNTRMVPTTTALNKITRTVLKAGRSEARAQKKQMIAMERAEAREAQEFYQNQMQGHSR
ncbi:hypothetical protein EQG49_00305 [Periweissella cryptocerci]|uniref:Uncharacterized protein n=1 Tax=Periweissella cryptocerci TaxID=2506420 RepID=A0A4P6YQX7_9LACO|nr:relaxase MobL [Periweissella cryptocerci]QBO34996.1 hypothetical protein EQG49_00305 [Periweissella cryptocerci]